MTSQIENNYPDLSCCRVCGLSTLEDFLELGNLYQTGFFPLKDERVKRSALNLSKCSNCGLVQLLNDSPIEELYGSNYGYESNLNSSMRAHLISTAKSLETKFNLTAGDAILDIASNDGTFLSGYTPDLYEIVGIDPLIDHLNDFYPENTLKIKKFFSSTEVNKCIDRKFNLITSFSVFYDLNNPVQFSKDIENLLAPEGVWVLEQSYLPSMFQTLGFDTICHEHLLYLTLSDLENITRRSGLKIFNVLINDVNGGSFQVYVCRSTSKTHQMNPYVQWLLNWEINSGITSLENCIIFSENVKRFKKELRNLLSDFKQNGFSIFGLGASTKGNVLLQYCELSEFVATIGEINPKKFGKVTPGSNIPIVNQKLLLETAEHDMSKSLGIILPWHFRNSITKSAEIYLEKKGSLLLPLPFPTVIN